MYSMAEKKQLDSTSEEKTEQASTELISLLEMFKLLQQIVIFLESFVKALENRDAALTLQRKLQEDRHHQYCDDQDQPEDLAAQLNTTERDLARELEDASDGHYWDEQDRREAFAKAIEDCCDDQYWQDVEASEAYQRERDGAWDDDDEYNNDDIWDNGHDDYECPSGLESD